MRITTGAGEHGMRGRDKPTAGLSTIGCQAASAVSDLQAFGSREHVCSRKTLSGLPFDITNFFACRNNVRALLRVGKLGVPDKPISVRRQSNPAGSAQRPNAKALVSSRRIDE